MVKRSAKSLVAPITLMGLTALSVLIMITFFTFISRAAFRTFCVPRTLVLTASNGLYSQRETCFKAPAWKTMSTCSKALFKRSLSRISPMNVRIFSEFSSCSNSKRAVSLLSRTLIIFGLRLTNFLTISLPIEPVPPVTRIILSS